MKRTLHNTKNAYRLYQKRSLILPMIRDAFKGRYRFSFFTLLVIVLSLVYIIFPFDLLPDFIPFIGWIDDGVFFYLLLKQLNRETIRYQQWRIPADRFHPDLFTKA